MRRCPECGTAEDFRLRIHVLCESSVSEQGLFCYACGMKLEKTKGITPTVPQRILINAFSITKELRLQEAPGAHKDMENR